MKKYAVFNQSGVEVARVGTKCAARRRAKDTGVYIPKNIPWRRHYLQRGTWRREA